MELNIHVHVAVIGCGRIGGRLAKEICRLANGMADKCIRAVALCDGAVIAPDDITGQEFLQEDIGWMKASVLSGVLSEAFDCVPVKGYGYVKEDKQLMNWLGLTNTYSGEARVAVIFDMTNGNRMAARCIRQFFDQYKNCIVIAPAEKNTLHTAVKLAGIVQSRLRVSTCKKTYTVAEAMRISRLCLTKLAVLLSEGRMDNPDLCLCPDGVGVAGSDHHCLVTKEKTVPFCKKGENFLVVCIGCGGTGGNFIKEFVHGVMPDYPQVALLMIDGDRVEEKNLGRQPFARSDLRQNKARCLREDLIMEDPALNGRLFDYPFYLDTAGQLAAAVALTGQEGKIIMVGAVDNHRARQVMEQFFHGMDDIVYVDAANEWSNGEVVVSVKKRGKALSPLRSFYFPDVLTDRGLSASEASCGVINESSPQHLCTNLASAQCTLSALLPVIQKGRVRGGIIYFDAFREYARYQEVWMCDMGAMPTKHGKGGKNEN